MEMDHPLAAAVRLGLGEIEGRGFPAIEIRVESDIPVSAGMGSSAAVSVAVLRAVAARSGHALSPVRASALAFEVEVLQHGTPSGIDNTVIAFERPVFFVAGQPPEFVRVAHPFSLIIADTGVRASTREVVAAVRERRAADPAAVDRAFDEIGQLAIEARRGLESGEVRALGPLLDRNQGLLESIGVSHPKIESLVRAARAAGALGAKLSGAGCGGIIIALVEQAQAAEVADALRNAGASLTIQAEVSG
jgi:mevalonate kinase